MKTCSNCYFYTKDPLNYCLTDTDAYDKHEVCNAMPKNVFVDDRNNICSLYTEKDYSYEHEG